MSGVVTELIVICWPAVVCRHHYLWGTDVFLDTDQGEAAAAVSHHDAEAEAARGDGPPLSPRPSADACPRPSAGSLVEENAARQRFSFLIEIPSVSVFGTYHPLTYVLVATATDITASCGPYSIHTSHY